MGRYDVAGVDADDVAFGVADTKVEGVCSRVFQCDEPETRLQWWASVDWS